MKVQVLGVERRTGVFKPKDRPGTEYNYDNLMLHEVHRSIKVTGNATGTVKLKMEEAAQLIAEVGGDPAALVGKTVDFEFDRFGKVLDYQLL